MESVLRKLDGFPIEPAALYKELETGCLRAVPNNDLAADYFLRFFEEKTEEERAAIGKNTRKKFEQHYQWDKSGAKWEEIFDSFDIIPEQQTWLSQPKLHQPKPKLEAQQIENVDAGQLAKWLIVEALGDPSKLNTFFEARLTRDLTYRSATSSTGGMYFNESSAAFDGMNQRNYFDYNIAYDQMVAMCERRNNWEQRRVQVMKQKGLLQ